MALFNRRHFMAGAAGFPVAFASVAMAGETAICSHLVDIKGLEFLPPVLHVKVGDRVKWLNHDLSPHTATALDGSWDTDELVKGQTGELLITKSTFPEYFCAFHPDMKAKLIISTG